jgi:hypothetical protein
MPVAKNWTPLSSRSFVPFLLYRREEIMVTTYPENTLEGLIARELVQMITECEDHSINVEPIQEVINKSRALMCEAGWPPVYQHNFWVQLRRDLTTLTKGHPVTRQFVQLLEIETEFN